MFSVCNYTSHLAWYNTVAMHLKASKWSIEIPDEQYTALKTKLTDNQIRGLLGPLHPSPTTHKEVLSFITNWIKRGGICHYVPTTKSAAIRTLSPRKIVSTPGAKRITFKECTFPLINKLSVEELKQLAIELSASIKGPITKAVLDFHFAPSIPDFTKDYACQSFVRKVNFSPGTAVFVCESITNPQHDIDKFIVGRGALLPLPFLPVEVGIVIGSENANMYFDQLQLVKGKHGDGLLVTQSTLLGRGWTMKTIEQVLGEPDVLATNPHYRSGSEMKLWRRYAVMQAELLPEVQVFIAKSLHRRKYSDRDIQKHLQRLTLAEWA